MSSFFSVAKKPSPRGRYPLSGALGRPLRTTVSGQALRRNAPCPDRSNDGALAAESQWSPRPGRLRGRACACLAARRAQRSTASGRTASADRGSRNVREGHHPRTGRSAFALGSLAPPPAWAGTTPRRRSRRLSGGLRLWFARRFAKSGDARLHIPAAGRRATRRFPSAGVELCEKRGIIDDDALEVGP